MRAFVRACIVASTRLGRKPRVFAILAAFIVLTSGTPVTVGQDATIGTADLIQGILARAENPFSGQMIYRLNRGFPGSKEAEERITLTFSGTSWRLKSSVKASEMLTMQQEGDKLVEYTGPPLSGFAEVDKVSHHTKYVELKRMPQGDGSLRNTARIDHQKPIVPRSSPYPPFFAGTLWYECTKKFIASHRDKAIRKSATEVNGVWCEVVEWKILPSERFNAFHSAGELTEQGGTLRVYTAADKGFALPRVEHVGRDGRIEAAFDSWDLREYADGVFIPQRCREQLYGSKGPGFYLEYQFDKIRNINRAIPDSEFIIPLPPGTHVSDARSGTNSVNFDIKKDGLVPEDLEDIITIATPRFWGWNWQTAFILGLAAGLSVLGLVLLRRRLVLQRRRA